MLKCLTMLFLSPAIILIALSLSALIFNSFIGFRDFHHSAHALNNWDTAVLASTNHIARKTNNFLMDLQASLIASLETYDAETQTIDESINAQRLLLLQDYLASIDPVNDIDLKNTIEFGLDPYQNTEREYKDYEVDLIHSDYIDPQLNATDKKYASSLISQDQDIRELDLADLENDFIQDGKLQISEEFLASLLDEDSVQLIKQSRSQFGLELNLSGMSLAKLVNGIQVNLVLNDQV